MFSKPIYVLSTPFYAKGDEIMILNPNCITAFGIDKQKNMFVNTIDGSRYYVAENHDTTAIELCKFMYEGHEEFVYKEIKDRINNKMSEQE